VLPLHCSIPHGSQLPFLTNSGLVPIMHTTQIVSHETTWKISLKMLCLVVEVLGCVGFWWVVLFCKTIRKLESSAG